MMSSQFQKGEVVSLVADNPLLDLKAGDQGVVSFVYDLTPHIYEVTFGDNKNAFDMTMYEEEIRAITPDKLLKETSPPKNRLA